LKLVVLETGRIIISSDLTFAGILVKEQPEKPKIDFGAVRDITVRAGEDFSVLIPYQAFPTPTTNWFLRDVILDDSDSRVHRQVTRRKLALLCCNGLRR
jgi:hypothetical protein